MHLIDDMSLWERSDLIRMGLSALRNEKIDTALSVFGAAIRRAEHSKTPDLEAELYKLFLLYLKKKDYHASKQRCLLCLNVLYRLYSEKNIPKENTIRICWLLERLLVEIMKRQGAGFVTLFRHYRYLHKGESYRLKKVLPLLPAMRQAWLIQKNDFDVTFNMIATEEIAMINDRLGFKNELPPVQAPEVCSGNESSAIDWSVYLQTPYAEWDDALKGGFTSLLETIKYPDQFQKLPLIFRRMPIADKPVFFMALVNNPNLPRHHYDHAVQELIDDVELTGLESQMN